MPTPVPALLELSYRVLGSEISFRFAGWDHGESQIWEANNTAGKRAFLKSHRQHKKFQQELYAYRNWCPALTGRVPQLLAVREEAPHALLLSALPGTPLENQQLERASEEDAHHQAGQLLARLHNQPISEDALPTPDEAYAKRLAAWKPRAQGIVEEEATAWVSEHLQEALPLLRQLRRVPCHRDYTPRNWLWHESQLSLIDFEHSRPDLWFLDIERLWRDQWLKRPNLREAFLSGYGRELTQDEEALLERLAALGALTTIVWAREHNDQTFEMQGRNTLDRLRNISKS